MCVSVCVLETGYCSESSKAHGGVWSARNACNHRNMTHHRNMSKYMGPEQRSEEIALLLATHKTDRLFLEVKVTQWFYHHSTITDHPKVSDDKNIKRRANWQRGCGMR